MRNPSGGEAGLRLPTDEDDPPLHRMSGSAGLDSSDPTKAERRASALRDDVGVLPEHPSNPPPFFIVGNDRSGTTMLRLILDRSREAAVPPESMFLVDFIPIRRRGDLADPAKASRFLAQVWNHPKARLWKLLQGPPRLPTGLGHAEAYRFIVEAPYRAYAHSEGKQRFGDKTPLYLHALEELLAIWPDARIVVVVRDGRDVALSIMRMPFGPNNVWAAARWWARGIRVGRAAERKWPAQVLTVRYEDLVADPQEQVRVVCAHVGLTYREEMLAIEDSERTKIVQDQATWFTSIWAGINASAVGKWRRDMNAREREVFVAGAGQELAALGYELESAGRIPSVSRRRTLLFATQDVVLRAANFVSLRLVRERGREVRYVLSRKLRRA
jgi:hypothetical protein